MAGDLSDRQPLSALKGEPKEEKFEFGRQFAEAHPVLSINVPAASKELMYELEDLNDTQLISLKKILLKLFVST